ncbi:MAG: TIGR02679 family protein [Actinobacteria bacterium]|nr:TIGR02679 family protein [Actinomycetota bacterium]
MTGAARASRPDLEPLWEELARRFSASDRPVTSVTVRHLSDQSRTALADLLGLERLPPPSPRVRVGEVARALGVSGEEGVRAAVEELVGPLGNRSLERRQDRARREALWSWLEGEAARLDVAEWSRSVRSQGIPGGHVAAHRLRLERAVAVLDRVLAPAARPSVLAHIAADVLGDPHALDPGQPIAALVVDALALRGGSGRVRRAEVVRAVWSSAGVATDELSPTVLLFHLAGVPLPENVNPVDSTCAAMAQAGEPVVLTLSQLQRWSLRPAASDVLVVENPSVVAHASHEGYAAAPVVCTGGWPNVAVLTLLRQLVAAGCRLRCHADFDPAGVLIVRHLVELFDAQPWEMTATAYLSAADRSSVAFDGSVADTPWDPALAAAMRLRQRAVFEEDVRHTITEVPK